MAYHFGVTYSRTKILRLRDQIFTIFQKDETPVPECATTLIMSFHHLARMSGHHQRVVLQSLKLAIAECEGNLHFESDELQ